ncbi:histidine kinase,histidine kinase [Cylindrospermum stagnale PCC 7417]|uniref:Histidine kinase,histidine kinase n=1 Tax=Cylindrospermum stagnale PCC 7417 TaxID=56107 RepID=K9X4I0_9NOST|nr:ATP-binding protein [Cylindrospermum stagnale]AFZ26971.1 histidine kinase,histidine kinase [Cylindrospermum stagnale PCC 7417]
MTSSQFNLSPQSFIKAFPFHVVFNRDRSIVQVGEVLQRIHPYPLVGSLIEQHFQILRPKIQIEFIAITKRINSLFLFKCLHNGMIFKGQMIYQQEQDMMFFLCSVWLNDTNSLTSYGLKLNDFAIHDQTVDLIFLQQGKNTALEDIQNLTNELTQQQAQLQEALAVQKNLAHTAETQAKKLEHTLKELQHTQSQLIQTEKMSSLGQLVAGVAHEINNPISFIYGNIKYIREYAEYLLRLIDFYQKHNSQAHPEIEELLKENDLEFIIKDLPKILSSIEVGSNRIREIVLTLQSFSRNDKTAIQSVDIHEGIDSTLLILQHRLQEKLNTPSIKIIKEYGNLPLIKCYMGQLNQVFMNILSNAIEALHKHNKELSPAERKDYLSTIIIHTQVINSDWVRISIKDNGSGMTEAVKQRIFDPFFTTKPVGEGAGLGLSISYQIIVDKHQGRIDCISKPGQGAEFVIEIPMKYSPTAKTS